MENECNDCEKVAEIKYGIIAQIFNAGINWRTRYLEKMDKDGNVPKEIHEELQTRMLNILDTYIDIVDLVWSDCVEENCDCENGKEPESEVLSDELKKKLKPDFNPN